MNLQYHVLVKGFEISRSSRQTRDQKQNSNRNISTTLLRHYRFAFENTTFESKTGSFFFYVNKELKSVFPTQDTVILVEEAQEQHEEITN